MIGNTEIVIWKCARWRVLLHVRRFSEIKSAVCMIDHGKKADKYAPRTNQILSAFSLRKSVCVALSMVTYTDYVSVGGVVAFGREPNSSRSTVVVWERLLGGWQQVELVDE